MAPEYHADINRASEFDGQSNDSICSDGKQRCDQNEKGLEPYHKVVTTLSDTHLATRKAEEAASRRFQASAWLQEMVGPFDLPVEPTEEEFRLCLRNGLWLCKVINIVHPGAVSKVVEYPIPSSPAEGALSAYQHFENVRNFLVAVNSLNLPSFEASDLEQSSLLTGSIAKVVDCILAIKAYHDWRQNGGSGTWKLGLPMKSTLGIQLCSKGPSANGFINLARRKWAFPDTECLGTSLPEEIAGRKGRRSSTENSDWSSVTSLDENEPGESNLDESDPVSAWIHHIGLKLQGALHMKSRADQTCNLRNPAVFNGQKGRSSQALLSLIKMAIGEKDEEEIPVVVEFMMRKLMEEFERQISHQGEQKKQLESALNEALREKNNRSTTFQAPSDSEGQMVLSCHVQKIKELKHAHLHLRKEVVHLQSIAMEQMKDFEHYSNKVATIAGGYHKVLAENRQLYNQVQDLKGNIRVYCRIKPWNGTAGESGTVEYIGENGEMTLANPKKQGKDVYKSFNFNKVFGPSASQENVFMDIQPLIRSVLDGFNVCIFAYGQTGSGKTFTMSGPSGGSEEQWGVNYRALNDLFHISRVRKEVFKYEVSVQMVEIYNEQVRDLFESDSPNKKLEIRNSSQLNGMNLPNAVMKHVSSTADVLELMRVGQKNRAVGSTAMNERSSRSHSVLTVHVQGTELSSGSVLRGCLHLVDLAGSERVDKSEATGERLKEAQHINKSLSALGDVISALLQKNAHIPYRNSKLTQLLQDSLGGQAKTMMFVHVSPEPDYYGETISTLKFAERVASVELGAARSNKECGEVLDLKDQVRALKEALSKKDAEIEQLTANRGFGINMPDADFSFEKLKLQRSRRSGTEDCEHRSQVHLEETATTMDSHSDKLMGEVPAPSPSVGDRQVSLDATNSVTKKASTERTYLLSSPRYSPLTRESLTQETSSRMTHCRSKIPRRLEPKASPRHGLDQLGKVGELHVSSKLSLEGSLTPGSNHSEGLTFSSSSWEKSDDRIKNDNELDDSVSSKTPASQESLLDPFRPQAPRLSDSGLHEKSGGRFRRIRPIAPDLKSPFYTENGLSTALPGDDVGLVRGGESRKSFETAACSGLPPTADNVLKPKKSPFSPAHPFQFSHLRSPLQIQKPKNDRRLSMAGGPAEGQRPLRRSLVLGATTVAPGSEKSIPKRPSLGVRASLELRHSQFSSENAALDSNSKIDDPRQQPPAFQNGMSPRSSKRWL